MSPVWRRPPTLEPGGGLAYPSASMRLSWRTGRPEAFVATDRLGRPRRLSWRSSADGGCSIGGSHARLLRREGNPLNCPHTCFLALGVPSPSSVLSPPP